MTHEDKINWMAIWAAKNDCKLSLKGTCGFGRDCVGILKDDNYPDYDDEDESIFVPPNAYHKHNCVAVLGHGEESGSQLYEWLKWFDENGYTVSSEFNSDIKNTVEILFGKMYKVKMVKKITTKQT